MLTISLPNSIVPSISQLRRSLAQLSDPAHSSLQVTNPEFPKPVLLGGGCNKPTMTDAYLPYHLPLPGSTLSHGISLPRTITIPVMPDVIISTLHHKGFSIIRNEPTSPIHLGQKLQSYKGGGAILIKGLVVFGKAHTVFRCDWEDGERTRDLVVPDRWVDVTIWRTYWWIWPCRALFPCLLKSMDEMCS
jgi:hypothetical protein